MKLKIEPFFHPTSSGEIFLLKRSPDEVKSSSVLVFVPPFAEEANKSRHSISLMASRLAEAGIASVYFDYFGSGESQGHFHDGSVTRYTEDLVSVVELLKSQGYESITLLGIRCGALIALNAAKTLDIDRLLFWNPVLNGKLWVNQFFRLRIAASMASGDAQNVSAKTIREELEAQQYTEIAGYRVSQTFVDEMESTSLETILEDIAQSRNTVNILCNTTLFEVNSLSDNAVTPVLGKAADLLRAKNVNVQVIAIPGDQFWMTQEITLNTALFDDTLNQLTQVRVE
ncbi:MAG: hydrolase 2, exosortase A system-associated [Pseudomonadales bacterium]|nr:hydrolase 2, exosortase A system-associated [Pseudomonadales bacterium]